LATGDLFARLAALGTVRGRAYRCERHGWRAADELDRERCADCGEAVSVQSAKMSTKRKNFVNVADVADRHGPDVARVATLSMGPHDRDIDWHAGLVTGARRWVGRLERLATTAAEADVASVPLTAAAALVPRDDDARRLARAMNSAIAGATRAWSKGRVHVAISRAIEATAAAARYAAAPAPDLALLKRAITDAALLAAPVAPFAAERLHLATGACDGILHRHWPEPGYRADG
jgi:leucyl-tRNA synthetase